MKMQDLSHKSGDYSRPNLNWRCGREECCQFGPTVDGQCRDEENKCVPKRSVKSTKRIAARWLFVVVFASLGVFLSASALLNRVSPGPVSMSHSEVDGCQGCHSAAGNKIGTWVKITANRVIGNESPEQHNDDELCLTCHALGENAFLAHSTSPANFSNVSNTANQVSLGLELSLASKFRDMQVKKSDQMSCSTCHREHKGELNTQVEFDSQKCHTCHEVKFDELEAGHPEYTNFPHSKPTNIQFDHASHLEKHFSEEDYSERAPEGCKECHTTDQTGEWMLSKSFEETCSTCHLDDVLGMNRATAKGISVLAIPELDVQTLTAAGFNIGEWPEWADGELTPFMRVLLPHELKETSLLQSDELILYDLSNANPEQLAAAALLAWEVKRLFYELLVSGTAVLDQRLSNALSSSSARGLDKSTINRLVAALPKDTLVNNQQQWFPSLMEELADYEAGKIPLNSNVDIKVDDALEAVLPESVSKSLDTSDILSDDDSDILSDDDSDILSDDDSDILSDDDSDILSDDDSDILSDDDSDILSDDDSDILSDDDSDTLSNDAEKTALEKVDSDEDWALSGGWYRDGSSVRYRPTDHADLFFKTWLELSAVQYDELNHFLFESLSEDKPVGNCTKCHTVQTVMVKAEVDNKLPEVKGSDVDVKQQSVEGKTPAIEKPAYKMHWQSFKPSDVQVDFNRFSHVSHFSMMTDDGCSSCHVVNSDSDSASGIESQETPVNENASVSGFLNMEQSTCTQCHQEGRAPDNCLTCHNYHAEPYMQSIEKMPDTLKVQ